MAYIIDETYFVRKYLVPNSQELNTGANIELQGYIDSVARLCLKGALGNVLFKDFDSNVKNGNLDPVAPQKWLNLVNGVEYVLNDTTYTWEGLKQVNGAFKESLLTPFVFHQWLYDNQSKMSGVGEIVTIAKNAINVNSTQRLVSTWNDFVSMYQTGCSNYNPTVFYQEGVRVIDWIGNNTNSDYVSLIKFLTDNVGDYPEASLKLYKTQNQLGL